ncbi:MAG: NAD-dependent epimerase/dehydratase family protein [Planctomycetota bacterium]|nr:MAG: NAD-dependent epimerase/dehydratase family protein [Planctomycetota bacterium]
MTGAHGCIGAWVVKALLERGDVAVAFDLAGDPRRLRLLLEDAQLASVRFIHGDVTDAAAVLRALEASGARHVIHLAGLQVPVCKAEPLLGARVNVLGTLHVLEAARQLGCERVVYASSAAVFGRGVDGRPVAEDEPAEASTHYGVFKRANEGNARVYWLDHGLNSVGLRPLTVYGVGRDFGLTSGPTKAMKAAVLGRPYCIRFSGSTDFLYAADAAAAFLAAADRAPDGASVFNVHGDTAAVADVVGLIREQAPGADIRFSGPELPIPAELDGRALDSALGPLHRTPLSAGVRETMDRFTRLRDAARLDSADLDT